jgi:hypothetical protein
MCSTVKLIQLLTFWALSIVLFFYLKQHCVVSSWCASCCVLRTICRSDRITVAVHIVPALSTAHIAHTRPNQESKLSYVKNHTITQHTLAIIHQTSYGTIIPYIKSNLLGSNDVWQYGHATVTSKISTAHHGI